RGAGVSDVLLRLAEDSGAASCAGRAAVPGGRRGVGFVYRERPGDVPRSVLREYHGKAFAVRRIFPIDLGSVQGAVSVYLRAATGEHGRGPFEDHRVSHLHG